LSATTDPVTNCDPFNGRIEATVDLDTEADYTFFWYKGSAVKKETDFDETGSVLDSLAPGFYTVQAMNNDRSCLTNIETIEIVDQASFTASILNSEDKDFGTIDNGSITIEISRPNRAYEILLNGEFYSIVNANTQEILIDSLSEGSYAIQLTDTSSVCTANLSAEIFTKPNTATDILSFELESSTSDAIINTENHTVEIEVEGLTDLTNLIPEIEISEGASISPATNIGRDFTEAVQYTVTAQDESTTQDWEVIVTKAEIVKEDQTITFNLPDTLSQDQSPYPLVASSSSGLPVRFSVESGSASIFDNKLIITSGSVVSVKAYQVGNDTINSAEVIKTVAVLGTYDISVNVKRPDDSPLEEGIAKLFYLNGRLYQRTEFTNGDLSFEDVRSGNYILQVIPIRSSTADIFPTYYANTLFNKAASPLRLNNNLSLNMKMKAKRSASNGNHQINGKVVWSDNQSNSRVSTGKLEDGEGVSEVILYLKNDANGEVVNGAVTDLEGNFKMENLTNGEFELLLDIPGLEESATSFELPIDGQIIELSVMVYINDKGIVDFEIITILSNELAIDQLNLYPNPTSGILYLNGYQGEKQEVSIVSSNGAIVKTIWLRNEQNQEIDLTDLDEGVYYLKSNDGNQSMLKIIKKQ